MSESTRDKIISIAAELFAKNGYDRTSIREISSEADVNLASINYHFKNKQNLYMQVLENNMCFMESEMERIADECESFKDYTWKLFLYFRENSNLFLNCFRLFITNNLPIDKSNLPTFCSPEDFNPPAFKPMFRLLKQELPEDTPEKGIEWATRHIFNSIAHSNLVLSASIVQLMEDQVDFLNKDYMRKSQEFLIDSVTNFLKENPDKFA